MENKNVLLEEIFKDPLLEMEKIETEKGTIIRWVYGDSYQAVNKNFDVFNGDLYQCLIFLYGQPIKL